MKTIEQTHKELKELDDIIHYINNIVNKLCNMPHHNKLAADIKHAFNLESNNTKEIFTFFVLLLFLITMLYEKRIGNRF